MRRCAEGFYRLHVQNSHPRQTTGTARYKVFLQIWDKKLLIERG